MNTELPEAIAWAALCRDDGEFMLAARHWNGGISISVGERELSFVKTRWLRRQNLCPHRFTTGKTD